MRLRRQLVFALAAAFASLGAAYPTRNFVVEAPTPQIAHQVGQLAEYYRREKAIQWLGQEMPPWSTPCPLRVKVTLSSPGGATSFAFDRGQVLGQRMDIEGPLERVMASVLPHEITHTVFAYYFRCPVPRWADEGGSVLSEDDLEKRRHDQLVRNILNTPGRAIPLRRLFALKEYPGDVMVLYAEGFSVSQYLVERSNRPTFLSFVAHGMRDGWDYAVQSHYRYRSVEELEQAWLAHLRATKRQPAQFARNTTGTPADAARVVVRQTLPPTQPLLSPPLPIYRGQMSDQEGERFGDPAKRLAAGRPGYLPDVPGLALSTPTRPAAVPHDPWQPVGSTSRPPPAPGVRLGAPQAVPTATPSYQPAPPTPALTPANPVGYPR
jgi:hypothetical protein